MQRRPARLSLIASYAILLSFAVGSGCSLQLQTPVAGLGQELFAPNGATAGNYCVQISDCPDGLNRLRVHTG